MELPAFYRFACSRVRWSLRVYICFFFLLHERLINLRVRSENKSRSVRDVARIIIKVSSRYRVRSRIRISTTSGVATREGKSPIRGKGAALPKDHHPRRSARLFRSHAHVLRGTASTDALQQPPSSYHIVCTRPCSVGNRAAVRRQGERETEKERRRQGKKARKREREKWEEGTASGTEREEGTTPAE